MESLVRMLYNCDERSMQIIKATVRAALDSQPKSEKEPMSVGNSHWFIGSASMRLAL